jgi:acetyl esterase/lipase
MHKVGVLFLNSLNVLRSGKNIDGLHNEELYIPSKNGGPDIRLRIYKPLNHEGELPGMLFLHGGGLVLGIPELSHDNIEDYIATKPCVIVAPDYRKAYTAPYPAAFNDCYDALLWMNANAKLLGIIPNKLIVAGHSAGGGLAAAVSLKATDTQEVKIAFQIPIYPMLDDRQNSESAVNNNSASWNSKANKLGWSAYLRELNEQGATIPPYAAAARANDYTKLPPTITFFGDLEPFKDETITYVENLRKVGIPVAFRLFEGCYHSFEKVRPNLKISKEAQSFLLNSYNEYVERYVNSK